MKTKNASLFAALAVCASLTLSSVALAAGSHEGGHGNHSGHGGHGSFVGGQPGKASEVDRTIKIKADDVHFDPKTLKVATGETIRFVITNVGKIDHDFTLGTPEVQQAHQKEMAKMMQGGGMNHAAHDDANAVMLKPGETKELIWTFAGADNFEFGCNVPGHYQAGMKGHVEISDHGNHGSHGGHSS
jgi:uncharacterized cupredoxin-like copper-binding protein